MLYLSWVISGLSLFGATFKSKKWIQLSSAVIGVVWFVFATFFNFSTMKFISYVNWPMFFLHTALVIVVVLIGLFFKKNKICSAIYGILAILLWSFLVDTVDYCFFFATWSFGTNYFDYVWNGIIFNLPKCFLPMCLSLAVAISSISFEFFNRNKITQL
jgi:hypothetical protein